MEILGYIASAFIGVTLGMAGLGGSILILPLLIYYFHIDPSIASSYSLFIIGVSAFIGGIKYVKQQPITVEILLAFAFPAFLGIFISRKFLLPAIPVEVALGDITIAKDKFLTLLLGITMIAASISIIRASALEKLDKPVRPSYCISVFSGFLIGWINGLIGIGGGFLIVPALLLFLKLPTKQAVSTSLMIVAATSFIGFMTNLPIQSNFDFPFLFLITGMGITGILLGIYLSKFFNSSQLKKGIAVLVLFSGIFILLRETIL